MAESNKTSASSDISVHVTNCETWEHNKKFTVYKIDMNTYENSWFVLRRFQEFHDLYEQLKHDISHAHLKIPGKKLFGNLNPNFIERRRAGLDAFVQQVFASQNILDHPRTVDFFHLNKTKTGSDGQSSIDSSSSDAENQQFKSASDGCCNSDAVNLGISERKLAKPSDFDFLNVIGKGSFGRVFLARHKMENNLYAVKVLQKDHIKRRNEVRHIMSERNVLVKNIRHPFLVGLHYSFQTHDKLYFVLDYLNGGELFFHLQKEKMFHEQRARFYGAEIASALGYLHSMDIIYRDLKPENLLLDAEGHVVLTDFGLCKEGIRGNETTATFCGTPEYLAPEVILKKPYDKTVDWWCLGSVLYEMFFGLPPFYNRDHKTMYENILTKPLRIKNSITLPAKDILIGMLQKDPAKRLGAKYDFEEIKQHAFFQPVDWVELEARRVKPPYNPEVASPLDLKNIDEDFLDQSIPDSVVCPLSLNSTNAKDHDFDGFSYVPPIYEIDESDRSPTL